jgi:hypothetical protein
MRCVHSKAGVAGLIRSEGFVRSAAFIKSVSFFLLAAITMATMVSCSKASPVVTVTGGKVEGVPSDSAGVMVFKGIPYAAPPVGDLRWKKPQPVQPWEGRPQG